MSLKIEILCAHLLSLLAGTWAGTASILLSHPIDTVKTRQQSLNMNSAFQCAKSAIFGEGVLICVYCNLISKLIIRFFHCTKGCSLLLLEQEY
jgi:hypothetical protein